LQVIFPLVTIRPGKWLMVTRYNKKVAIIFEELSTPHSIVHISLENTKSPEFVLVNPDARLLAIGDPNTGIVLWQSGAIIEYLVEQHDRNKLLTYRTAPEKYHLKQ
jgi:glutathione S-transferase